MLKRTLSQVALACAALTMGTGAQAALTDGKFGSSQIFDVQYWWNGTTLNASNFIAPYDMNFSHPTLGAGQYFAFFASTTNPGTYGLGIYNSNGTLATVVHNTGDLQAIGPNALFYVGSGFFGTVITTGAGYAQGSSASFTNMNTSPQASDITSYTWASTTPLAAGQTAAPSAPSGPTTASVTNGGTYTNASGTNLNPSSGAGIIVASGSAATTITNAGTITANCTPNATDCAGIVANAASNVTITNSGDIVGGIYAGVATIVTNTGNISSSNVSGISQFGVRVQGDANTVVTNSGNITSATSTGVLINAIGTQGSITPTVGGTINNFGSITGGAQGPGIAIAAGATGVTVTNTGIITGGMGGIIAAPTADYNLNSSQAGLVVDYKLPTNFNTIINSTSSYGQLVMSANSTGSMNFGIYGGGVSGVPASTLNTYTYVGVLQGVSSTNWANVTGTTGTYGGYSYSLVQDGTDPNKYNLQVGSSAPTVTGTTTSSTVTTSTANGASTSVTTYSNGLTTSVTTYADGTSTTTSTSANGSPVVTTNSVTGSPIVSQANVLERGQQTAKTLTVNNVLYTSTLTPTTTTTTTTTPVTVTTVTTTPRTATTVTTTPVTATTVTTTPTTVTTTTTPVTVTTYSDNTQTTTTGNPTTTTAAGTPIVTTTTASSTPIVTTTSAAATPIVTTTTSAGSPIVAQNIVIDNGSPVVTQTTAASYSTRIDGYSRITQSSAFVNSSMTNGVVERHTAGEEGIKQRIGAYGDEKQGWMYIIGEGVASSTSDGYKNSGNLAGLGYERKVSANHIVGGNFAQARGSLTTTGAGAEFNKQVGSLYSLYAKNGWLFSSTLGHSDDKYATTHSIQELQLQNGAQFNGTNTWLSERVYTPAVNNFKLLAGVRADQSKIGGYTEAGSQLTAQTVAAVNQTKTTTEYGARWDKQWDKVVVGAEYVMRSDNLQTTTVTMGFTPRSDILGQIGVRNQKQDSVQNNAVFASITVRY